MRRWHVISLLCILGALSSGAGCTLPDGTKPTSGTTAGDGGSVSGDSDAVLSISPRDPQIVVNESVIFDVAGGEEPYSFTVFLGDGTIDPATGLYTAPALPRIEGIEVTDANGETGRLSFLINAELTVLPDSLAVLIAGTVDFDAIGGTEPYIFSVTTGTGTIDAESGEFTAPSSSETDTITVTDAKGRTATYDMVVYNELLISPPTITLDAGNIQTFEGAGGVTPYIFAVVTGSGTIDESTGEYTAGSTLGYEVVRVTDAIGNTASATVTIISVNDYPTISDIADQVTDENTELTGIEFEVDEGGVADEDTQTLLVTAQSDNQTLVPDENITVNYTADGAADAEEGTIDIVPAADQNGTATILVTVSDGTYVAQDTFILSVPCLYGSGEVPCTPDAVFHAVQYESGVDGEALVTVPATVDKREFLPDIETDTCLFRAAIDPKNAPPSRDLAGTETVMFELSELLKTDVYGEGDLYYKTFSGTFPYGTGETPVFDISSSEAGYDTSWSGPAFPGTLSSLEVNGAVAPDSATTPLALSKAAGVAVTWVADAGNSGDVVIQIVSPTDEMIECVVTDDGAFTIGTATLNQMGNFTDGTDGQMVVTKRLVDVLSNSESDSILSVSETRTWRYSDGRTGVAFTLGN